jgi:hypothetical protein
MDLRPSPLASACRRSKRPHHVYADPNEGGSASVTRHPWRFPIRQRLLPMRPILTDVCGISGRLLRRSRHAPSQAQTIPPRLAGRPARDRSRYFERNQERHKTLASARPEAPGVRQPRSARHADRGQRSTLATKRQRLVAMKRTARRQSPVFYDLQRRLISSQRFQRRFCASGLPLFINVLSGHRFGTRPS